MVKRLLIIVPVVVLGLTLVSLFMPARRVSIEGVGKVSFETTVTLSVGSEVAYASPDVLTNSPASNTGSAWTAPENAYADGGTAATITSGAPSGNNVWGTYGFNLTGDAITQVRVRYDAWSSPSNITVAFQAVGALAAAAGTGGGAATLKVVAPANQANDILIAVILGKNNAVITVPSGCSPQSLTERE